MAKHFWEPSSLNHGSQQCVWCRCTYEEASLALGMECKHAPEVLRLEPAPVRSYTRPRPISPEGRMCLQLNLMNIFGHSQKVEDGRIK